MEINKCKQVDVVLVGLGVSSIALARLMDEADMSYSVISERDFGVWSMLAERGDDFDLLSSSAMAAFSWWEFDESFPFFSASEYYDRLTADVTPGIKSNLIRTKVSRYVKADDGSYILYRDGEREPVIRCKNLIITIGQSVNQGKVVDYLEDSLTTRNSNVFIEGYGDSTNLLMARLMVGDNKVYFQSDHFKNLDKVVRMDDSCDHRWGGFDLFEEYQHFYKNNFERSMDVSALTAVPPYSSTFIASLFQKKSGLNSLMNLEDYRQRDGQRNTIEYVNSSGISAGWGYAVKYWPVDAYFDFFESEHHERMVKEKMLLNDPNFIMHLGKVEVAHSNNVQWKSDNLCVINGNDVEIDVKYALNTSRPNEIEIESQHGEKWLYKYKECFHGLHNQRFPGLFFLGVERPVSGGFAPTSEMQCHYIFKMLSDSAFKNNIESKYENLYQTWVNNTLDESIVQAGMEHAQHTGESNRMMATLMGVEMEFWPSLMNGSIREYLSGTCMPMRYSPLTGSAKRYKEFCKTWTNRNAFRIFSRANYVYFIAINFICLGLFSELKTLAFAGLVLLFPRVQKVLKCMAYDFLSFGQGKNLFQHLVVIFTAFIGLNILAPQLDFFQSLNEKYPVSTTLFLTGIPVALLSISIDIARFYFKGRLLFNDIRGKKKYRKHYENYLETIRCSAWYRDLDLK